ncbi:hypothetical protein G4B88_007598 [Cannabis sativa]|uniref:Ubiquitin-like protease family profile domain-containing protein n=1 Tax=Cannabis sativa TaxID=3483 RepID=A0A7J6HU70_CANSA|nr:hypothetical protein G4B88_007598 [Cannabis sativa]
MGASSSSAHENVSRVEDDDTGKVDDAKKPDPVEPVSEIKQSEVVEENIDVDATISSTVKAVENLIGSSTHVPTSVETSEKNDLEMVVFQETPILCPQKRDQKKGAVLKSPFIELASGASKSGLRKHKSNTTTYVYCKGKDRIFSPFRFGVEDISNKILDEKFVEKSNDISVLSLSHNVAQYIRGGKILCATPWHLVDHVVMPINVKLLDHWICGRLNIAERRIYLYNSLCSGRYMTAAKEACKPFSVILPYYFSMLDFKGLHNEAKFSTMELFPIVAVDGLPEQYFIDGKPIPSSSFNVEIHRDRLAVLFYHYGMKKQLENIESEFEAPPNLPKK